MKTRTALTTMVALLLLTICIATPAFAQKRDRRSDKFEGFLSGKFVMTGGWCGGESYLLQSPDVNGDPLSIKQKSGFEFSFAYKPAKILYIGSTIQNARNAQFGSESGIMRAKMDETRLKFFAAIATQWVNINNWPTEYSRWQGIMGYSFDASGKTLSIESSDGTRRPIFNEIGNAHEDNFFMAIRSGIGTQSIGLFFVELRYSRSIPRISLDGIYDGLNIENRNLNRIALSFGINM